MENAEAVVESTQEQTVEKDNQLKAEIEVSDRPVARGGEESCRIQGWLGPVPG